MIYGTHAKYSMDLPKDKLLGLITYNHDRERLIQLAKGLKLTTKTIRSSKYDGDNFVRNLITVIVEYEAYRVPRFLKKHLVKKFRLSNSLKVSDISETSVFG